MEKINSSANIDNLFKEFKEEALIGIVKKIFPDAKKEDMKQFVKLTYIIFGSGICSYMSTGAVMLIEDVEIRDEVARSLYAHTIKLMSLLDIEPDDEQKEFK